MDHGLRRDTLRPYVVPSVGSLEALDGHHLARGG